MKYFLFVLSRGFAVAVTRDQEAVTKVVKKIYDLRIRNLSKVIHCVDIGVDKTNSTYQ